MSPLPLKIFGGSEKSTEFSFTAPGDAQDYNSTSRTFRPEASEAGISTAQDGKSAPSDQSEVAALIEEVKGIKEMLRALLVQKAVPPPVSPGRPDNTVNSLEAENLETAPLYRFYDESEILALAKRSCPQDDMLANFRRVFLTQFHGRGGKWNEEVLKDQPNTEDSPAVFSCPGPNDTVLRIHGEVPPRSSAVKRWFSIWPMKDTTSSRKKALTIPEAANLLEEAWPVTGLAQGVKIDGKICIKWKVRPETFRASWTLLYLYYGNDSIMKSARFYHTLLFTEINSEMRTLMMPMIPLAQLCHEVISPGKIWLLRPCHDNAINFDYLAFLSALLLHPFDMGSSLVLGSLANSGDQFILAIDTICSFAGPWKPMHLRERLYLIGDPGGSEEGDDDDPVAKFSIYRRHDIRCFSSRDPNFINLEYGNGPTELYLRDNQDIPYHYPMPSPIPREGLATARQSGMFPSLQNASMKRFSEKRLCVVCLASDFDYASSMPTFRILVINDFPEMNSFSEDDFKNWRSSGLKIEGILAWYMAYQATIFGLVPLWEREWASCLDELDNSVRVKIEDIMDANLKDSMMFDASFKRSRFYFEVIQLLRIFSDMIRETGRDLQTMISDTKMFTHLTSHEFWQNVSHDKSRRMIHDNWEIVDAQQKAAERRLLDRITELSGDMQSLRDGLFNATALLEASRSTTMSRYVFAFTIVTVVFLPPSFIATVFSTQFFNKDEMPDTIALYRDSTIAVALVTYVASIVLIYLSDRFGLIQKAWAAIVAGTKAIIPGTKSSSKSPSEKTAKADTTPV